MAGSIRVWVALCALLSSCAALTDLTSVAPSASDAAVAAAPDAYSSDAADAAAPDASKCEGGFCQCSGDAHTFCDDFDDGNGPERWALRASAGSDAAFVSEGVFSSPFAAHAYGEATDGSASFAAFARPISLTVTKRVRVEFGMQVNLLDKRPFSAGAGHGFSPVSIKLHNPFPSKGGANLRMNLYSEAADLEQLVGAIVVDGSLSIVLKTGLPKGRYGLWLDLVTQRCGSTFNGVERFPKCMLAGDFQDAGTIADVTFGIEFVRAPSAAWDVTIDDVVIDYE